MNYLSKLNIIKKIYFVKLKSKLILRKGNNKKCLQYNKWNVNNTKTIKSTTQ